MLRFLSISRMNGFSPQSRLYSSIFSETGYTAKQFLDDANSCSLSEKREIPEKLPEPLTEEQIAIEQEAKESFLQHIYNSQKP